MKVDVSKCKGRKLHLIDVSAVARTKWYFYKDLSAVVDGVEYGTGAMYAIFQLLGKLPINDKKLFAFDMGRSFRKDINEDYKSNRGGIADDYYRQIDMLYDILVGCGFEVFGQRGYEADDFIAGLVKYYSMDYDFTFIHSNDSDLSHLVRGDVILKNVRAKSPDITVDNYEEVLGIPYNTRILYKSIVGDSADNVKGVRGIGDARFKKIISRVSQEYDLAELSGEEKDIIENLEILKEDQKQEALESLKLTEPKIPQVYHFEGLVPREDYMKLKWYLKEFKMNSVIEELEKQGGLSLF